MTKPWLRAAPLLLLAASPAAARDVGGAWKVDDGRVTLRVAQISVPDRAGVTSLTKTGEFRQGGKSLDNYAQYESPDGQVFATVYVYRTTYADAALAAYATGSAIAARFGAPARLSEEDSVTIASTPRGAIRQVFIGASLKGEQLATGAAFARIGGWVVKLRVSGPEARRAEVVAALDALIGGVVVGSDARVLPATPLKLAAPCPAPQRPEPRMAQRKDAGVAALFDAITGGSTMVAKEAGVLTSFPDNGRTPACVRGSIRIGERSIDILQPADQGADPSIALVALDDAGTVLTVERGLEGSGYTIKRYTVGEMQVAGAVDAQPTADQLEAWLQKPNAPQTTIRTRVTVTAEGKSTVNLDPSLLK